MSSARKNYSSRSPLAIFPLIFLLVFAFVGIKGFLVYKESKFTKFDRFNVVLAYPPLTLVSVDSTGKSITEISFPKDLYISELAFGYGGYKSTSIYSVGELDKRGGETVMSTLSDYLGIPVDGYIYASQLNPKDILTGKSNLNVFDQIRLVLASFQTRSDKIKTIDLAKYAEPLVLSDGSTALSADKEILDERLRDNFIESRIRQENLRLEIFNSTKIVGLANRAGRVLTNIGVNVVSVNSSEILEETCRIKAKAKIQNSITVHRIADVFSCKIELLTEEGRAEIEMIIGKNYAKTLGR